MQRKSILAVATAAFGVAALASLTVPGAFVQGPLPRTEQPRGQVGAFLESRSQG
eukprot:CAMPEP_0170599026 /NCGR_PEP_ID=MMETSP0224-20130122/16567_1 /TAXON_ID=285029 /ORGANISM="Togula jolla, Strain CCCM 725" /LENGTH=53 /DNA_ID=CAMNT_0010923629 /DNA_START=65 /DNA_END=222 /DNA_ORIENTATION=-